MQEKRYIRGKRLLEELVGDPARETIKKLNMVAPDAGILLAAHFGDFYSREGLDLKTREMVTLSSLAATGKTTQLKVHLNAAVTLGCTCEEICEIMIQLIPYNGFPTALNALEIVREFFQEKEEL